MSDYFRRIKNTNASVDDLIYVSIKVVAGFRYSIVAIMTTMLFTMINL